MENKKLLITRYFTLSILIFSIISIEKNYIDAFGVILLLLLIINNQIRFFAFRHREKIVFLSIILELIISYICHVSYGGWSLFYLIVGMMDGILLLRPKLSIITSGGAMLTMILMTKALSIHIVISNIGILLILALLTYYIKEEYSRLIKAKGFYDKLRISEENLLKANRDLEIYADSIKELATLRERNRISREIHDSVGHSLSTIIIQLGAIEKIAVLDGNAAAEMARNLNQFAKNGLEEIRVALRQLKPRRFEEYENILAIEEMIREFTKLTGVDVIFRFTKEKWPLSEEQALVIYRIVQEFLSNSLRHGKASKVNIYMNYNEDELILTLQDNGQGVDKLEKGMGLTNIWERVRELDGQIEYNTKRGKGFVLRVVLKPMEHLAF
ncbi:sensor histidine kinase [Clostridium sp. Cult3]|uniref:sensor histidine kinase n=1 Tax=Clostridium sp. Cult3 TaxID=2079004 RepID=UPI001F18A85B|nr:sensor histidine kinase [Clostridium sp. Cult3]MCF6460300.1 sensor histidine kinase [Clostridium sp. Cult3]